MAHGPSADAYKPASPPSSLFLSNPHPRGICTMAEREPINCLHRFAVFLRRFQVVAGKRSRSTDKQFWTSSRTTTRHLKNLCETPRLSSPAQTQWHQPFGGRNRTIRRNYWTRSMRHVKVFPLLPLARLITFIKEYDAFHPNSRGVANIHSHRIPASPLVRVSKHAS